MTLSFEWEFEIIPSFFTFLAPNEVFPLVLDFITVI